MPRPILRKTDAAPPAKLTEPSSARVTLRDVASHLGVSHVAVSLALRGRPGVSEQLRERVRAAARSLGYRPDPMLAALNNYRHGRGSRPVRAALAWITLWRDPARLHALRELDAYWLGAKEVAEKHGYHLYEFHPDAKNSLAAVQRVMSARNIEGVLLSPPDSTFALTPPAMDWARFSVVRFGHSLPNLPFHMIGSAQASNTAMAISRMRERGYRRIGFVSGLGSTRHTQFLHGFLRTNEDIPPADRVPYLNLPHKSTTEDGELVREWMKTHRPDAIFSNVGSIRALLATLGCEIPGNLGLAVTSVQDCDADCGIDQSPMEIGRTACETLISLLMHGHRGIPVHPREILVEGRWQDGATLPTRVFPAPGSVPRRRSKPGVSA